MVCPQKWQTPQDTDWEKTNIGNYNLNEVSCLFVLSQSARPQLPSIVLLYHVNS